MAHSRRRGLVVSSEQAGSGLSQVQAAGCSTGHKSSISRILAGSSCDLGGFSRSGASWPRGSREEPRLA